MKNYLLITLGHNSSAIFVDNSGDEQAIIGYEQERLSGIKADSQFPFDAINEIIYNVGYDKIKDCAIRISHWFNTNCTSIFNNKYLTSNDYSFLVSLSDDIVAVSNEFTHHDAHAYSAYEFFKYHHNSTHDIDKLYCIVADGFGTNEEVLSIYCKEKGSINLIHNCCDLKASLGLMYQYATSFVGMKENQDEYKFLGYESHINSEIVCSNNEIKDIDYVIDEITSSVVQKIFNSKETVSSIAIEQLIDYNKLQVTREYWNNIFNRIIKIVDSDIMSFKSRCAIAYFIQNICENVITHIIYKFGIQNLVVAGGTFYNVKLNNKLLNSINGLFSVMPLAGDQGAAIGMYANEMSNKKPFQFGDLCWGKRRLYNIEKLVTQRNADDRIFYYTDCNSDDAVKNIAKLIADGNIVNVVTRFMEFGPRALCNTSTLFLPTSENVHYNNVMNGRNEVMPCAPVCTKENAYALFGQEIKRVVGSDKYMICTHAYKKPYSKHYGGVMHKKPLINEYTGRPQIVVQGSLIDKILRKVEVMTDYKAIVNTSFNVHGRPIAFDTISILENFEYQCEHAHARRTDKIPYLFIID